MLNKFLSSLNFLNLKNTSGSTPNSINHTTDTASKFSPLGVEKSAEEKLKEEALARERHINHFIETADAKGLKEYLERGYVLENTEVQEIFKKNIRWLSEIDKFGTEIKQHILEKQTNYLLDFVSKNMRWSPTTMAPSIHNREDYENLKNMRFFETFQKEKIENNQLITNIFHLFPEAFKEPEHSNLFQLYRENMEDTVEFLEYVKYQTRAKIYNEEPLVIKKIWIDSSVQLKDKVIEHAQTLPPPTVKRPPKQPQSTNFLLTRSLLVFTESSSSELPKIRPKM